MKKQLVFVILLAVGLVCWFRFWETAMCVWVVAALRDRGGPSTAPSDDAVVPPARTTIRFLRLQRTSGTDDAFGVSQLEAYDGNHRWPAMDGVVAPGFADPIPTVLVHLRCGWERLTDESPHTMAHTARSPYAYMELDLGAGGRHTDRIRIVHTAPEQHRRRMNGVTLYAMDENRTVVFHHTFTEQDERAPRTVDFPLVCVGPVVGAPPETGQRVRYVRLAVVSPSSVHARELSVWQGTQRRGQDWCGGNGTSADAYVELDLGTGGRWVDRVRACIVDGGPSTTLYVMDPERRILATQPVDNTDCVLGAGDPTATPLLLMPPEEIKRIRYLRLTRTTGDGDIVETALEGYLGPWSESHWSRASRVPLRTCRYFAVAGTVSGDVTHHEWMALNDGLSHTACRTNEKYVELDFGEGGRRMNRVRTVHRRADMDRVHGVTLRAMNEDGGLVFEYMFPTTREDSAEVVDVDVFGRLRCQC